MPRPESQTADKAKRRQSVTEAGKGRGSATDGQAAVRQTPGGEEGGWEVGGGRWHGVNRKYWEDV
jgi:hypothetical protein